MFLGPVSRAAILDIAARVLFVVLFVAAPVLLAASQTAAPEPPPVKGGAVAFVLKSSAFEPGANIPVRFTCDGADASPPLSWTDPPAGTKTFALVVDDPDAPRGTWTHWLLWNLPATARALPQGVPRSKQGPEGAIQGQNGFGRSGYGGPCPPPGAAHRYFFRLIALDGELDLAANVERAAFDRALASRKALAVAELMGRYAR